MAIWTPSQKAKGKKLKEEGCSQTYEVELPAQRVQEALHNTFLRLQLQARVAGFRQGKAPLELIKKQYAQKARAQAIDDLLKSAVPEAIQEFGLHPIAMPVVSDIRMEQETSPLKFQLHVEVAPRFEPKGYKGLALTRKKYPVTDAEVQERLLQLQESNARLEKSSAESVGSEHYVILDYELSRDGKKLPNRSGEQELVDMSSDQTIQGLTEGLIGAKRQESREISVDFEGPALCKVTVHEIKEKILPTLDDDFAKDMGLDTLEALKAKLREIIAAEAEEKTEREVMEQIEKGLLAENKFPVPPSLAERQLERTLQRVQRDVLRKATLPESEIEKLKEKLRPEAENHVRLSFILSGIAERERISVSEEDFQAELNKNLAKSQDEKQKRELQEFFEKSKEDIRAILQERKVLTFIREAAKVTEETA